MSNIAEPRIIRFYLDKDCTREAKRFVFTSPVEVGTVGHKTLYIKNLSQTDKVYDIVLAPIDQEVKIERLPVKLDPLETGEVEFSWTPGQDRQTPLKSSSNLEYKRLIGEKVLEE